ncbi:ABC transporter permease [Litchfieldia salsa]|uniref:Putative ABC transport system permease protein n=1 Tax=Litchfieldia salsa TaxID=930152 RepID=A0A1H0UUH0_9BACI|nr:ABC transporter permease [Litchfieldia salsa]SDP69877.1 putative ABC transport system permease protein [Litchfieldia salsa]
MNFIKRAVLSVKSRIGKSLLQVFIFTVICVLVLSGITIQSAANTSSELARQKLGGEVTLQMNMEKIREQQQTAGERTRFQAVPINAEVAGELLSYSQVKAYNFFSSTNVLATDFDPIENETNEEGTENETNEGNGLGGRTGFNVDVSIQGVAFTDSVDNFLDGTSILIEGRHLTEEDVDQNVTLIESSLASENELVIGDTITVTSPNEETLSLELQIVGIYETTSADTTDQGMNLTFMNPYNMLYVPYTASATLKGEEYTGMIDSAIYYMNDPATIDQFVSQAMGESSIDFDTYKLDANDTLYQQMVGPIQNVASFSKNVVYLVTIAGAIILGLIVMMSIRERKYEMGVLLAIGENRFKLIGQFITEIIIVAVLALGIATMSGNLVASKIGEQLLAQELTQTEEISAEPASFGGRGMGFGMGRGIQATEQVDTIDELQIAVTSKDLVMLAGIGLLIAIISTLVPSLSVLRLQPKTILTKQD